MIITPKSLNEINLEFWRKRTLRNNELLSIPEIADIAARRALRSSTYIGLSPCEEIRRERIRNANNLEIELENIEEEFGLEFHARHQRRLRAKGPRGRIVGDKSLTEIIVDVFSDPEKVKLTGKAAWKLLPDAFSQLDIVLSEVLGPSGQPSKDRYTYAFRGRTKSLSRGHFRNLLTQCKKRIHIKH